MAPRGGPRCRRHRVGRHMSSPFERGRLAQLFAVTSAALRHPRAEEPASWAQQLVGRRKRHRAGHGADVELMGATEIRGRRAALPAAPAAARQHTKDPPKRGGERLIVGRHGDAGRSPRSRTTTTRTTSTTSPASSKIGGSLPSSAEHAPVLRSFLACAVVLAFNLPQPRLDLIYRVLDIIVKVLGERGFRAVAIPPLPPQAVQRSLVIEELKKSIGRRQFYK